MKAIVVTAIGEVELQELPQPVPGPGQVRIRTAACGICATDLTMIHGCDRSHFPSILGHEWSGTVDAVGDGVDGNLVGSHCVGENVLQDGGEIGFEHPGGYGEYLVTEASNIHVIPEDFSLTTAALVEPLAVGVRGFKRLRPEDNSRALIFGDGPIGLIMLMLLKLNGFESIVLVGGRPQRLGVASDLGAEQVLNYHELGGDLAKAVRDSTEGLFPNVIEASGSSTAMRACLELTAPCGHILMLGDYEDERADFALLQFLQKEYELIASNASAGAWPEAVKLAVSNQLPLERLVRHTISPEDFAEGLEWVDTGRPDVIKAVIDWTG